MIKPGLGEELAYQRTTYGEIVHQPSSGLNQQYIVTKTIITDSPDSSDSSEHDGKAPTKRVVKVNILLKLLALALLKFDNNNLRFVICTSFGSR